MGYNWERTLAVGRQVARKGYDPDQPRDPAGTPTGGQWTASGGSLRSGQVRGTGYRLDTLQEGDDEYWKWEDKKGPHTPEHLASQLYFQATEYENDPENGMLVAVLRSENTNAPMAVWQAEVLPGRMISEMELLPETYDLDADDKVFHLNVLASNPHAINYRNKGWGAAAFASAVEEAVRWEADHLVLHSSEFGVPFYRKMGMREVAGDGLPTFVFNKADMKEFLDAYRKKYHQARD